MADPGHDEELARLRVRPDNVHLAGGYGPLLVGLVLFVLMVVLAPSIAPERVVERPVKGATTSTTAPATTTSTAADASTSTTEVVVPS